MKKLMEQPLKVYQKSGFLFPFETDSLCLFRLRNVNDNINHSRKDIFHVPGSARSMISTCRYSIAGYPSLYLTTSIQLGMEEISASNNNTIISQFRIKRDQYEINMRVLELGIKPQDFYEDDRNHQNEYSKGRNLYGIDLLNHALRSNYLRWFPLIAACSFIRANKHAPFSSEYIIPQLLMQWARGEISRNELIGIRYFSCASIRASNMGFDYVFQVNNTEYEGNYCSILRDSFRLTNPVYLKEYDSIKQCEYELKNSDDYDKI